MKDFDSYDGLRESDFEYFTSKYLGMMDETRASLAWAVRHPDLDYIRIAPYQGYHQSNGEVFFYIRRFHVTLERFLEMKHFILPVIYDTLGGIGTPGQGLLFDINTPTSHEPDKPTPLRPRDRLQADSTSLLATLRTILYELFYLDSPETFTGLNSNAFDRFRTIYSAEEIQRARESLRWAMTCDDFDFKSLLPNLPHDNGDILGYLTHYHDSLEDHAKNSSWAPIDLTPDPLWPDATGLGDPSG